MKSAVIEVQMPDEITEGGRYSPRFIGDDIAEEIDVIQDKHAPLFSNFFQVFFIKPTFISNKNLYKFCRKEQTKEIVHSTVDHSEVVQVEIVAVLATHFGIG